MNARRARLAAGVLVASLSVSCVSMWESMFPLDDEARRVVVIGSGQDVSVELATHCRKTGKTQLVVSEHFAKLEAAKVDANVAQILTAKWINGSMQSLDVRFWSCPSSQLARLDLDE